MKPSDKPRPGGDGATTTTMMLTILLPVRDDLPKHVQAFMRHNIQQHIEQEFGRDYDPTWVEPAWAGPPVTGRPYIHSTLVETHTHTRSLLWPDTERGPQEVGGAVVIAQSPDRWSHDAIVERMKAEIAADIDRQVVPDTVTTFAQLHDHVDANGYGGFFDPDCPFDAGKDEDADRMN